MLLLCAFGTHAVLRGEYVFLKDGKILKGTISGETAANITLQKSGGSSREIIPRENIMRILYTELYMGKVFVQKTDGKGIACYMVDEDRTTYTFRNDINSPTEFTLLRDQVLFIARRNPSGLQGAPSTDSIQLKWLPPYNQVKEYRVYLKGPNDADFRRAAATSGKEYELEGLKSNTSYKMHVTAVAREGDESMPSNEITVTTKNIRPNPPAEITAETTPTGANGKITARFLWQRASDPDGRITGYTVYRLTEQGKKQEARVPGTEYTARNLAPDVRNRFEVASVDDRGDESEDTADISVGTYWKPFFEARLNYIVPKGSFSTIMKPGPGGMVTGGIRGLFFREFDLGLTTGLWRFDGNYRDIDSASIIPILAMARWRIDLIWNISAAPSLYAGYGYERITYAKRNATTFALDTENKTSLQPMAMGGIDFIWSALKMLTVNAGISYGAIFEGERMDMMEFHLGAGYIW